MFVVHSTYLNLTEIEQHLAEHRQFLDTNYAKGLFIASGAKVPRTGGVILVKAMPRAELELLMTEDPFHRHQLAEYQIIEFNPNKVSAEAGFLAPNTP